MKTIQEFLAEVREKEKYLLTFDEQRAYRAACDRLIPVIEEFYKYLPRFQCDPKGELVEDKIRALLERRDG